MHSHHSHSGAFCCHASPDSSPNSMLQVACDKGFSLYCLSEHIPRSKESQLYPEEVEAGLKPADLEKRFEEYLIEAHRCSQKWNERKENNVEGAQRQLQVLVGAELENTDDDCFEYMQRILNGARGGSDLEGSLAGKGRVDFLIGSVHHVNGVPIDFDRETFELALDQFRHEDDTKVESNTQRRRSHLRLIHRYLEQQSDLLKHFEPEIVGHFDLCRLFEPGTPMTKFAASQIEKGDPESLALLEKVDNLIQHNVEFIRNYGGLIEVNAASIRKGWDTPYPGEDILDIVISAGARLCLSDDAHSHQQVGLNYHKTKEYLERKGIKSIWRLQRASFDSEIYPRGTEAIKVEACSDDPFWSTN